jgi:glycosyltransferase involved in cell wall biosynthesis
MVKIMNNSSEIYFSVIVCIYNGERTLKQALNSLAKQNYPKEKYEIILVNDGSGDESEKICLSFIKENIDKNPIIRYVRQENKGLSSARNLGIVLSKGEIVAFIDQDAVADINWIKNLAYEFDVDQDLMVIGGKTEILNDQCWFANLIFMINYKTYDNQIAIIGTNMAYRKEIFKKVGGFYKAFKHFGDESIFQRKNILNKYKVKQANTAIVFHEWPIKLRQWLRECALNGKYYLWGNKIIQMKNRPKILIKDGLRLFSILLFPSFLLTLINPLLFGWILILSSLQLLHRMYTRRKAIYKIASVSKIKAVYLIPYSIIIIYLGMFIMNINYLMEWLKGERINFNNSIDSINLSIKEIKN